MTAIHTLSQPKFAGFKKAHYHDSIHRINVLGKSMHLNNQVGIYVTDEDRPRYEGMGLPKEEGQDYIQFITSATGETDIVKYLPLDGTSETTIRHHFRPTAEQYVKLAELVDKTPEFHTATKSELLEQLRIGAIHSAQTLAAESLISKGTTLEAASQQLQQAEAANPGLQIYG